MYDTHELILRNTIRVKKVGVPIRLTGCGPGKTVLRSVESEKQMESVIKYSQIPPGFSNGQKEGKKETPNTPST